MDTRAYVDTGPDLHAYACAYLDSGANAYSYGHSDTYRNCNSNTDS